MGNSNYFWQKNKTKQNDSCTQLHEEHSVKVWQAGILKAGSKFSEPTASRRLADGFLYEILLWLVLWFQRTHNKFKL